MSARVALLALAVCACGNGAGGGPTSPGGRLHATVVRPASDTTRDTVRFDAAAQALHCAAGRGVLMDGVTAGNGVLLWLRPGDSALAGTYVYAARGDSALPERRSAVATVRFTARDVPRGVVLDSGELAVRDNGGTALAATIRGSGLTVPEAVRVTVEADFDGVPAPSDTVPCVPDR